MQVSTTPVRFGAGLVGDPAVYYEVVARILAVKPTAGWKANAYVIFDYWSANDFKFAGIDVSINKLVMGYRDASGWNVNWPMPRRPSRSAVAAAQRRPTPTRTLAE